MDGITSVDRSAIERHLLFAGRYQINEKIAAGATASVYRAMDLDQDVEVAVKLLHPHFASDRNLECRFKQEMHAVSNLNHPNIVNIFACDINEKRVPYLVMELVHGCDLSLLIKSEPIDLATFFDIMIQVCSALAHAHSRGVIHRDVKPSNIIVEQKNSRRIAKLVDFGIAKLMDFNDEFTMIMTQSGTAIGSPYYMSPEQARGEPADTRSDIYSLACVMFEILTGRPPFVAEHMLKVFFKHLECKPPDLDELTDHAYPESLNLLIQKCLEKDPEARYENMFDLRMDLERISSGLEPLFSSSIVHEHRKSSTSVPVATSTCTSEYKQIFSGTLSYELQLNQVLERISNLATPALSILILESQSPDHTGFILIRDGKTVSGATVPGLRIAGYNALKRLMTIADGKFTYLVFQRGQEPKRTRLDLELSELIREYPKVPQPAGGDQANDPDPLGYLSVAELEKSIFTDREDGAVTLNLKRDDWREMPKRPRTRDLALQNELNQTFRQQQTQSITKEHRRVQHRKARNLIIWLATVATALALCIAFHGHEPITKSSNSISTSHSRQHASRSPSMHRSTPKAKRLLSHRRTVNPSDRT